MWHINGMTSLNHLISTFMDVSMGITERYYGWKLFSSNKNPRILAKFYLDAVAELKVVSKMRC